VVVVAGNEQKAERGRRKSGMLLVGSRSGITGGEDGDETCCSWREVADDPLFLDGRRSQQRGGEGGDLRLKKRKRKRQRGVVKVMEAGC
jgi:hypothetical protein